MKDELNMMNHSEEDQEILQLLEMMSQLPEAPVPDEFDLRLRRALKQETAKKKSKKSVWKKWTAAAACLMVGLLSFQMLQGGVSADMMEGTAETSEIGEISGTVVEVEAEFGLQRSDEVTVSDDLPLLQEEPVLISDIIEGNLYGVGIDGEPIQISRGAAPSSDKETFLKDCDQVIQWITDSISQGDSGILAQAMNYKNSLNYSEDQAEKTLKLYDDLLQEEAEELGWKRVNLTAWSRSNIYRIGDGFKEILVIISDTPDGLVITEPVMAQTQWLYEQIGKQEFTLVDMIYDADSEEIEFLVKLKKKSGELRSFVWKEIEL